MAKKCIVVMIALLAVAISNLAKCQEVSKFQLVYIEYIGPSDKYLPPILISNSRNGAQWYLSEVLKKSDLELAEVNVLSASLTRAVISSADGYRKLAQEDRATAKAAKPLSIALVTPRGEEKFLLSIKEASSMLDDFKRICKSKKRALSDISYFQFRIRAYDVGSNSF